MSRSWDIFRNINEHVRFGDAKAGVILAFSGGSAAFLAGKSDLVHNIIIAHRGDALGWALYAVFVGYGICLVCTAVFAFKSIQPSPGSGDKRSLIYFGHIREVYQGDHARYAKDMAAMSDEAFEEELAHQICTNSGIATKKFAYVSNAMTWMAWMGAFWTATVFLLLILGSASTSTQVLP